ncbi:MAG: glycosyltransferase [Polyangiaceae bacterium]|jgi:GT2 family glycosyltransferase
MGAVDVSVVIATYRREKLLLEAIASVCSQRGVELEVIVVDDSPDGTAEASVRSIDDSRVRYLHRATPSGGHPGAVRNDGVAVASAPLLHFLDDDDRLVDGCLRDLATALGTGRAGMAFGRVVPFGDDARVRDQERRYFERVAAASKRIRGRRWFAAQVLFREMPFVNSACMVRREVFQQYGGYDSSLRAYEDVDLYLRIGRGRGFTFVDRDVLHYRVGAPSIMNEMRRTAGEADGDIRRDSYRKIHQLYKREHGIVEYRALQIIARAAGMAARTRTG